MMTIIDEQLIRSPAGICFNVAADVERWPDILPHYRFVRFREKTALGRGVVEMSAYRRFAPGLNYPTWWVSQMRAEPGEHAVYYTHIEGVTRGMDVKWELHPRGNETFIRLFHTWDGPAWPIISGLAAKLVILPHFVSAIAQRTLAGVAREAEARAKLIS
jgi:ribosome-associated toxin RatA of RatAB toxin-antitoxin module